MAYPDKVLADDEEVVRHLHPHWLTVFWPVVWLLVVVGAASFGAAAIPVGRQQGLVRLLVLALALLVVLVVVARPLLRWRTTHYVVTTHRLLFREGVLARRGRDIGLSRITDVSYRQTLWERVIRSGTLTIESAGEGGGTVLRHIPDSDGVQRLLNHMIEEDADRRARESAGYLGQHGDGQHDDDQPYGERYDDRYDDGDDRYDHPRGYRSGPYAGGRWADGR